MLEEGGARESGVIMKSGHSRVADTGWVKRLLAVLATLLPMLVLDLACDNVVVVELVGTIELRTLEMATPVSEVIIDIPVAVGDQVAAGQVLVQMDNVVAAAELEASQAAMVAAEATLTAAEQEHKRYQGLRQANVAATRQLDESRRVRDEALATVAERKARIAQASKRLESLTVRAYTGGVVDQLPFDLGERVPGGGVVAVLLADEKPFVKVWLPARLVALATRGSRAEIRIEGFDRPLQGHLVEVAREPEFTPHFALTERESAHLVYEARIEIDEPPEQLRPGLPARVELSLPKSAKGG